MPSASHSRSVPLRTSTNQRTAISLPLSRGFTNAVNQWMSSRSPTSFAAHSLPILSENQRTSSRCQARPPRWPMLRTTPRLFLSLRCFVGWSWWQVKSLTWHIQSPRMSSARSMRPSRRCLRFLIRVRLTPWPSSMTCWAPLWLGSKNSPSAPRPLRVRHRGMWISTSFWRVFRSSRSASWALALPWVRQHSLSGC